MACMCGDICCPSCGPAQGNFRCPICRAWASDCCEHFEVYCTTCGSTDVEDHQSGGETCAAHGHTEDVRLKSEFQAEADERARQDAEAEAQLAKDLDEADRLADEYWKGQRHDE